MEDLLSVIYGCYLTIALFMLESCLSSVEDLLSVIYGCYLTIALFMLESCPGVVERWLNVMSFILLPIIAGLH